MGRCGQDSGEAFLRDPKTLGHQDKWCLSSIFRSQESMRKVHDGWNQTFNEDRVIITYFSFCPSAAPCSVLTSTYFGFNLLMLFLN